jgi:hypothetical protein
LWGFSAVALLTRLSLVAALVLGFGLAALGTNTPSASAQTCQTSFIVFTDPNNTGEAMVHGKVTVVRDSGVLGSYLDGRLANYAINGLQDLRINTVTNQARINGSFTATSPDGASSISVRYAGRADLTTGKATGTFVVFDGTGTFAGYRAHGTIDAQLVGPATFQGVDIGLC